MSQHALFLLFACANSHILTGSAVNADGIAFPEPLRGANATVLALSGSLRRLSSNSAIARAAAASSPLVVLSPRLDALPFFDADKEVPLPPPVARLRALAFAAGAFFFATPEYNGATSAVLKNAIDWLSRSGPEGVSPLKGKAFAVASAGGGGGGMRAQANVAAVLQDSDMVRVGGTGSAPIAIKLWDGVQRFSPETGDLVDPETLARVGALVAELLEAAADTSGAS